jgi:hypothetical protein
MGATEFVIEGSFEGGGRRYIVARVLESAAQFVGWDAFEDLLESADPDLLDLERPSLVESDA